MPLNKQRWKIVAAAGAAVVLIAFIVVWRVSRSHARSRASELLSATADMVRCVGGDAVPLERNAVDHAFHRRLVTALPDIVPVSDCPQAMETVQEKLAAHQSVWFGSMGSKGKDGQPIGSRIKAAMEGIQATPFNVPANKVLAKREQNAAVLNLSKVAVDLFEATEELYDREGASDDELKTAREKRLRSARKVQDLAPNGTKIGNLVGRVPPSQWAIVPADNAMLMVHAWSDGGQAMVATSGDAAKTWSTAAGPFPAASQPAPRLRGIYGPANDRWIIASHLDASKKIKLSAGKLPPGATSLPNLVEVPAPPAEWNRPQGGERELAVLPNGLFAYPVQKIVEKTDQQKKDEEKERKAWDKNLGDKDVQAAIQLNDARIQLRKAIGADEDRLLLDGVAYAAAGREVTVRELPGYGLLSIVPGADPQLLLGKDALPAHVLFSTRILPPEEPLGMMNTATSEKMVATAFRASPKFFCAGADGAQYGITDRGLNLVTVRPASLEIAFLKVDVPEECYVGCGEGAAVITLPFQTDRIFTTALTVRGGEVEGAKVATTSGTHVDEYNRTSATAVVPGAVVVAWIAEGYAMYVVSKNWGTEFGAPNMIGEAKADGSRISGVKLVGLGSRLLAVIAREICQDGAGKSCATSFEALVSDDAAKTWKAL